MAGEISRRSVVAGGSLLAAALALGIDLTACTNEDDSGRRDDESRPGRERGHRRGYSVLTAHEAAVVVEATARLIPGPTDDPSERGHPGAREADVVRYIDGMLGALREDPPLVYAGGPFSDRGGADHDDMAAFVTLPTTVRAHWKARLADLTEQYRRGVRALDTAAGGSFVKATASRQDEALVENPGGFRDLLFQHAIEGTYAVPEYLGNTDLVGWKEVRFPGDTQPRGYTERQVSRSDGPDEIERAGVVAKVLDLLESSSPASSSKPNLVPGRDGGS